MTIELVNRIIFRVRQIAGKKYRQRRYKGNVFYCPFCEQGYSHFFSFGRVPRPNAMCPGCGSLERHRLLWIVLTRLWETHAINNSGFMLHVAPEPVLEMQFRKQYDYLSVDLADEHAMRYMDITAMDVSDNTFDAIVCNHVLEHISDDGAAISELFRVLKPNGWASIQVPMKGEVTDEDKTVIDPQIREARYGQADHVRQYGSDFKMRLEKEGFTVMTIKKEIVLDAQSLQRLAVDTEDGVWICLKKVQL